MEFPKFFESAATNVPRDYANDGYDDIAPDARATAVPQLSAQPLRPAASRLVRPIEESIATWSEVRFSRAILPASLRPKPASYQQAVEALASTAPLGYRDWKAAASDRKREGLVAAVASLIADQPIATGRWGGWLTEENKRSVPRRWVGDLSLLPAVGALEKSAPNVTVKAFERWLKVQGITWVPSGQGSHRKFQHDGRWQGYGTSGSSDRLYFKDAKRLAKVFRYPTVADFLIAVAAKELLRTAVAA